MPNTYQEALLDTALELAEKGYFVFPLTVREDTRPGLEGKKMLQIPFPKGGGWRDESTRDSATIRTWFGRRRDNMQGVAIDCGKSGICAVDLDVSNGKDGLEEWKKLPAQQETPMTVVTRSGGLHRIYADPSGLIVNSSNAIAPGIDIRGAGGLIITAPTMVIGSAGRYSFGGEIVSVSALPVITDEMTEIVTTRQRTQGPKFNQDLGPYRTTVESGQKLLNIRYHRMTKGESMRGAIFGYAVAVTQFEVAKAKLDDTVPDSNALVDYISSQVLQASGYPELNDEDIQWIEDGIAKGFMEPWEITAKKEEPPIDRGLPLDDLLSNQPPSVFGVPATEHALVAPEIIDGLVGKYIYVSNMGWHEWVGDRWAPEPRQPVLDAVRTRIQAEVSRADRESKMIDENVGVKELRAFVETMHNVLGPVGMAEKAQLQRVDEHKAAWKRYRRWWSEVSNGYNLTQIMKFVVLDPGNTFVRPQELDQDPEVLNCPNGTVDLRTGDLRPHNPHDYITKSTGVAYDPNATHPLWDKAKEAFAEGIEPWLQMRVGEGAFGFPSKDDTMLFNFGGGSNGKSTLTDAILGSLGDYAVFLHDKAVLGSSDDHTTEQMVFRGARWAILEELPEAQVLRPAQIKKLIGTAYITARLMRQDNVTFKASHCLMINSNHKPTVLENDRGTWRRLVSIPWPYTFKFENEPLEDDMDRLADPDVKRGLARDGAVQRAALRWIVEGAVRYTDNGDYCGPTPEAVLKDTEVWRLESDTFGMFFNDRLEFRKGFAISGVEMLQVYNEWMEDLGKKPVSDAYVGTHLKQMKGSKDVFKVRARIDGSKMKLSTVGNPDGGKSDMLRAWHGVKWKSKMDDENPF